MRTGIYGVKGVTTTEILFDSTWFSRSAYFNSFFNCLRDDACWSKSFGTTSLLASAVWMKILKFRRRAMTRNYYWRRNIFLKIFIYCITFLTRWSFDSCLGRKRHSNLPLSAKLAFLTRRIDLILLWAAYLKKLKSIINITCNKLGLY